MSHALANMLGLGLLLIGIIAFEVTGRAADDSALIVNATFSALPGPATAALAPRTGRQIPVDDVLARPLFAATRRPAIQLAGPAAAPANLPRLTGILVNGRSRSVIFEALDGERPVVAQEGARIGAYTVQSIEARRVTLSGPDDTLVLWPAFDPRPKDATRMAALAPAPSARATYAAQGSFSGAAR